MALEHANQNASFGEREPRERVRAARCVAGFADDGRRSSAPEHGAVESLQALPPGAALVLRLGFDASDAPLHCVAEFDQWADGFSPEVRLGHVLEVAFPNIRLESGAPRRESELEVWRIVRAAPLSWDAPTVGPRLAPGKPAPGDLPLIVPPAGRGLDVESALAALRSAAPAELRLSLAPFILDARGRLAAGRLEEWLAGVAAAGRRSPNADCRDDLGRLAADVVSGGVRIDAALRFAAEPDPLLVDLVSIALFGRPATDEAVEAVDLRGVWPLGWRLPRLLPTAAGARRLSPAEPPRVATLRPGGLRLGETPAGASVVLSERDRARHLYVIGATGTGKSSLLLDLFRQDVEAGEGAILLDPHGDLADDARRLVARCGRTDIVFGDAADPEGNFRLDVLEGQGGDPALERNYVANALIRVFTRVLYRDVPEAFGPMFESYFRNALLLLTDGGGPARSLLDFDRIFFDKEFRSELLEGCADEKVGEFWTKIAPAVTHDEISLANIAPYITCKLAQFTGNPLMRRVLCAKERRLDFGATMDAGGVLILKAAKGVLGQTDAELLCAMTSVAIAQAGLARAAAPRAARRPSRVYIDEFQTCAGEAVADLLAESRKYGVSLVLANQSLGQVDGDRRRAPTGAAALANAANLVAFRLGADDAARLAPWFAPDVGWTDLCRQPDFHATARVLQEGRPSAALLLRTPAPP